HIRLDELKKQVTRSLKGIKDCMAEKSESNSVELKSVYQNLEQSLQDQFIIDPDSSANSTGTQYLHSMGFDQIVNMINAAAVHEPEWMSRTGTVMILDNNPNTSQAL